MMGEVGETERKGEEGQVYLLVLGEKIEQKVSALHTETHGSLRGSLSVEAGRLPSCQRNRFSDYYKCSILVFSGRVNSSCMLIEIKKPLGDIVEVETRSSPALRTKGPRERFRFLNHCLHSQQQPQLLRYISPVRDCLYIS